MNVMYVHTFAYYNLSADFSEVPTGKNVNIIRAKATVRKFFVIIDVFKMEVPIIMYNLPFTAPTVIYTLIFSKTCSI